MNKELGVVFGWGAARGFAHLGIISYLEEKGIRPTEVAGTNIGAIMWACLAIGMKTSDILVFANSINYLALVDMNLKTGLVKWDKIYKKLEELYGDRKIEDLDVKLRIVATNINTWEKYVFEKWKIVDAVRASINIPTIFSFFETKEGSFIDGGVLNNLPIETLDTKKILAVSVMRNIKRKIEIPERGKFSLDFRKGFLWINYQVLQKTIDIMMKQNEEASHQTKWKDIFYLEPSMKGVDYYEFNRIMDIYPIWYNSIADKEDEFLKWLKK